MTEVIRYHCKACGKQFGTMGMHGYSPETGRGELPVVCPACKDITVGRFRDTMLLQCDCRTCGTRLVLLDGTCPACGADELYFSDARPGVDVKATDARKALKQQANREQP